MWNFLHVKYYNKLTHFRVIFSIKRKKLLWTVTVYPVKHFLVWNYNCKTTKVLSTCFHTVLWKLQRKTSRKIGWNLKHKLLATSCHWETDITASGFIRISQRTDNSARPVNLSSVMLAPSLQMAQSGEASLCSRCTWVAKMCSSFENRKVKPLM